MLFLNNIRQSVCKAIYNISIRLDIIQINVSHNFQYLDFNFDILRDERFVITVGEYRNLSYTIIARTAPFRRFGGSFNYQEVGFWTGNQTNVKLMFSCVLLQDSI